MLAVQKRRGNGLLRIFLRSLSSSSSHSEHSVAKLAHELVRSDEADKYPTNRKSAVVLHGMLGNHKNLRQLSTKLANQFPNYDMLLVTHRAHGQSEKGSPPHTLHQCALDLLALLEDKGMLTPDVLIGHSFGAKVSVTVLDLLKEGHDKVKPPRVVWSLDCPPGAWKTMAVDRNHSTSPPQAQSVEAVIQALRELPQPFKSKNHLVELMTAKGFTMGLAQWMTLNIRPDRSSGEEGLFFSFDLDIIEELFNSHKKTDLWPVLESEWLKKQGTKVNFIQAGLNAAWEDDIIARFNACKNENVKLIEMPGVGHWLHVEAPDKVHQLIAPSFLPPS